MGYSNILKCMEALRVPVASTSPGFRLKQSETGGSGSYWKPINRVLYAMGHAAIKFNLKDLHAEIVKLDRQLSSRV